MAEEAPAEQKPQTNVASKEDVAAAVEKAKTPKISTIKLPKNFLTVIQEIGITLKDIKVVNTSLEKAITELNKSNLAKSFEEGSTIKDFFKSFNLGGLKAKETTPKLADEDTGAAVLKKQVISPVKVVDFTDEALRAQYEFYKKEPLPIKLTEIDDKIIGKLEKLFEKLGKGRGGETGGFFNSIVNAVKSIGPVLRSLGAGLGKGFEFLGKGIGAGITAIGKGIGGFLAGFGAGLGPLAAGLRLLANPQVAIGLGLVILAINGIALALRIAAPAIKEIIPLFEKIANVIGNVFLKAVETVGEVFKAAIKEIPNMIRAVGDAISTILERAGPTLLELARIVGDVVIKAIKEIRPIITALTPAFTELVRTLKEGVIETLKIVSPIFNNIVEGIKGLGNVIENVLIAAIKALSPVLEGLMPFLENLVSRVSEIITTGMGKAESIVKTIGNTILGVIKESGIAVKDILTTVTDSISRLADIGFVKLTGVAGGITAIASAVGLFGAGAAAAGIGAFFGSVAGKAGGGKTPFAQLTELADRSDKINTVADNIKNLASALKIITDQEFSNTANSVDRLADAFLKFNNLDIEKLKEITQLPLKKITTAVAIATVAAATAVATPAPGPTATSTEVEPPAPGTNLFAEVVETPEISVMQGEFKANTTPILPVEPSLQSSAELTLIVEKLEELIETLQPLLQDRKAVAVESTSSNNINTAAISNNNTNTVVFSNNIDRDIPFLERNKYREQFLYNRGLI